MASGGGAEVKLEMRQENCAMFEKNRSETKQMFLAKKISSETKRIGKKLGRDKKL